MGSAIPIAVLGALACCSSGVRAQEVPSAPPAPAEQVPAPTPSPEPLPLAEKPAIEEVTQKNPRANCLEPPPVVEWEDYHGPFAKTIGIFAQQLERGSVPAPKPHFKPGAVLCTLPLSGKFKLFVWQSFSPAVLITAGFNAGIEQAQNVDPSYGQGAQGYAKRYAAQMADHANGVFFKYVVYPTIFREDPRYYRLAQGPVTHRFFHAVGHAVIAHHEDGTHTFNFSEWLGGASAVALSNTYHPDNKRGWGPGAQAVATGVAWDAGFDVLREFWPELARKFHLPYRGQPQPPPPAPKN